jgi:predicted nucleic acid-binding protein
LSHVVADASLCAAWILPDEASGRAEKLLAAISAGTVGLFVPALWHYEMNNLLRSAVRRKRMSPENAQSALEALSAVPILHEDSPEATARRRIFHLAGQFSLSSYDASYLELADRFKIPLFTSDVKLGQAAAQLGLAP